MDQRVSRYMRFLRDMRDIYELHDQDDPDNEPALRALLLAVRHNFFTCTPARRLAIASQVRLAAMASHLSFLAFNVNAVPDVHITRPVYNEVYDKVLQWRIHRRLLQQRRRDV